MMFKKPFSHFFFFFFLEEEKRKKDEKSKTFVELAALQSGEKKKERENTKPRTTILHIVVY